MAGTIELPTLIQKIRVDTRSMNRAEKAAGKFGATADESFTTAQDSADDYTKSSDKSEKATRKVDDAMQDLAATVKGSRVQQERYEADLAKTRKTTSGFGDDTDDTSKSLGLLGKGFKSAGGGAGLLGSAMGSLKLQVVASGVTVLASAIGALTAGAIGFIGQVAPLVGVLGSIPAALGALLSTKLVFSSLIKGPVEAAKAIQKYGAASNQAKEALKKLTPEARKFTLGLVKTQNAFKKARDVAGRDAFPGLEFALEAVRRLMPIIQKGMVGVASTIGAVATAFGDFADSKAFHRDFGLIVDRNTKLVATLGEAVVPLLKVFINITKAAGPMTQAFAGAFLSGSKFLATLTGSKDGQTRLTKFFEHTTKLVFQFGRIFRDAGVGLFNLFTTGAKHSTDFVGNLETLAKKFRRFTESVEGKGKLAKFFEDAKPVLHEVGLLVRDIFKGIGKLSGDANIAPLISQIRTELLPAFLDFAGAVNTNIAPVLVKLATAFLDFQKVLTFSPIVAVAGAFADLTIAVTKIIDKVPGLSTLVATLLAFSLATKGIALAGKVTGVTKLVEGLSALGPAGKAGQKGVAGFVQGLRGASGAGGKLTVANLFGKAVKGAGGAGKKAGSAFIGGIKSVASSAASAGTSIVGAVGKGATKSAGLISKGLGFLKGGVLTILSKMGPMLSVIATGLKVAAGAARAFALALLANPVVLIIAGLIALGIALVVLYKKSETFRNIVNGAFTAVKNVVMGVLNFLKGFIAAAFNFYKAYITTVVKVIATIIRTYFAVYKAVITTAFKVIKAVISAAWGFIKGVVGTAVKVIATIIRTYVDVWKTVLSKALDVIKGVFHTVFVRIPEIVREKLTSIVKTFAGLGARILGALGNFGELLFNAGKELILGLARGIAKVATAPIDAVKSIVSGIGRLLPGSPVKDGPLRKLNRGQAGGQIATMLADGIDKNRRKVARSAHALAAVADLAATVGGTPLARATSGPGGKAAGVTQITYDQRKSYDVDVHETTGPTTVDSLTRRLAAISLLGPSAASMGVLVG